MLYLNLLQTVAAFIVKATKIDANGDGDISGKEIQDFLVKNVLPIFLTIGTYREQALAFLAYTKDFTLEKLVQGLRDIVEFQLLPSEMAIAEEKIDRIAGVLFPLIIAVANTVDAFKEVFGNKTVKVTVVSAPKVNAVKAQGVARIIRS